ncbi:20318_t:CDS:2, partial [Cetraspora pellucida]
PSSEFKSDYKELMKKHNVEIKIGTSHRSQAIVKRFNRTLAEKLFRLQNASDLLLPISKRSRAWVKNLPIIVNDLNNSVTRLIGMTPAKAIKMKQVIAISSKLRNGPIGFNESKLLYNTSVRYLLEPGELEGGYMQATDMNWSPQVYYIHKALVQKNQPILYWLEDKEGNRPKQSFVRKELQIIHSNTKLPPQWVLTICGRTCMCPEGFSYHWKAKRVPCTDCRKPTGSTSERTYNEIFDILRLNVQEKTYEEIMNTHKNRLAKLNINLCRRCLYPIKVENREYCDNCQL